MSHGEAGENSRAAPPGVPLEREERTPAMMKTAEALSEETSELRMLNRAMINLLEDFDEERNASEAVQKATLNLLEDMNEERNTLDNTQRALLNMLEDVEVERVNSNRANSALESANEVLRERSRQLRALASELTLAEQRERQRLAQVLHDGLQQTLVGAKLRLEMLGRVGDSDMQRDVTVAGDLIAESIRTSRQLTAELNPPILYEGGLAPALESLARWMRERHGLLVELKIRDRIEHPAQEMTVLLYQATRELLFNVVKHAGVKHAILEAKDEGDDLVISVADDGSGFEPSTLRAEGGTDGGFGLVSIRERLALLGGTLEIQSAPNQGCRFTLVAPRASGQASLDAPAGLRPTSRDVAEGRESATGVRARKKIRIVLVDDHVVVRRGLAVLVNREPDMDLIGEAADGESAVMLILDTRPDVVLMDISMPCLNGIEATRIVHAQVPEVKVIGFSMFEEPDRADAMREAGAVAYLTKSGPSELLLSTIRACVDAPDRQPGPGEAGR